MLKIEAIQEIAELGRTYFYRESDHRPDKEIVDRMQKSIRGISSAEMYKWRRTCEAVHFVLNQCSESELDDLYIHYFRQDLQDVPSSRKFFAWLHYAITKAINAGLEKRTKIFQHHDKHDLIQKYFSYLFDDYAFSIAQVRYESEHESPVFGDWEVYMLSDTFRIRIFQSQGDAQVALSPFWDHPNYRVGPWVGLELVIAFLNQGNFVWKYLEKGSSLESQLEHISHALHPYMDKISEIFRAENFPEYEVELGKLHWGQFDPPFSHLSA
ncbi:hypothetical protein BROC_02556 [Candidatus Brocadiaceae bacterium]|nr:hypothetical protein BROC_02556 [Candidatus Brocadiaceae bacterium]